jgi:hypothetical protein
MAIDQGIGKYDPQIAPERKVVAKNQAEFEDQKGHKRIQRVGEQWYMTCTCKAVEISTVMERPNQFIAEHVLCEEG